MIRRPPRSTQSRSSAASDVYKRQGSDFAGDAVNTEAMRQIGRELEGKQRIVQLQMLANVLAQRRISSQFEQTAMVFRQLELTRGAQHALAFHATQLAHLDQEGLAVFSGRQLCAHQG